MKEINKEFKYFKETPTPPKNIFSDEIYITKSDPIPTINESGNIVTKESYTYYLATKNFHKYRQSRISKNYFGIKHIDYDYYIVINPCITELSDISESLLDNKKFKLKFGIIKIKRDYDKSILINKERTIAPIIYDQIYIYDNFYPIVELNNHYTYFCLDETSKNYGKQLLPLVLEAACPFNIKYKGFAECTIEGETRFIPIDFIASEKISKDDLLTEEEVICLINSQKISEKIRKKIK